MHRYSQRRSSFFLSGHPEVKYKGMQLLRNEGHSVPLCCELLGISRSGLSQWEKAQFQHKTVEATVLEQAVQKTFDESRETYGRPRILAQLKKDGFSIGGERVRRIMGELDLVPKGIKKFAPKTTINNPSLIKSARVFKVESHQIHAPNQVWVSDLTYFPLEGGTFGYLVTVMDLFNREVKGWNFSDSLSAEKTKDAILMAIKNSRPLEKTIFHSDQGVQYCSEVVKKRLELLKMVQSMSRKGNCYDNAFAESFFSTVKREIGIPTFKNIEEGKEAIKLYLEWYNKKRIHSSLGNMSPLEYLNLNRDVA